MKGWCLQAWATLRLERGYDADRSEAAAAAEELIGLATVGTWAAEGEFSGTGCA